MKDQRHLRPGVKLGNYPQRPPFGDNRFERALKGWLRGIRPPPAARRGSWRRFLRQLNSHSDTLADAGKNRLADHRGNARRHLNNDGLTQAAIARAFAIVREVPAASDRLPSAELGSVGGGTFQVDPQDQQGTRTLDPVFQFDLSLPPDTEIGNAGGRVYVRFDHGTEPLAQQWYRSLRQLFLRQFTI